MLLNVVDIQQDVWQRCLPRLKAEIGEQAFNTWIRPLQAERHASGLRLLAPNRFVVDYRNAQYLERIRLLVREVDANVADVETSVGSTAEAMTPAPAISAAPDRSIAPMPQSRLMSNFTFESFVEGKSNQLARAAASQVAENPGLAFNPLFLYVGA